MPMLRAMARNSCIVIRSFGISNARDALHSVQSELNLGGFLP